MPLGYLRLHHAVQKAMAAKKQKQLKKHSAQKQKHQKHASQQICCEQPNVTAFTQNDTVEFTLGNKCYNSVSMVFRNQSNPSSCRSTSISDYSIDASSVLPPLTLQSLNQEIAEIVADNSCDVLSLNSSTYLHQLQLPPIHELNLLQLTETPIPIPVNYVRQLRAVTDDFPSSCHYPPAVLSDDSTDIELENVLKNSYGPDAKRMSDSLKFLAATLKSEGNTLIERLIFDSPDQSYYPHQHIHNDNEIRFGNSSCHCMRIVNVLGCGSFGIVLRCRLLETNQEVALKIIDKQLIHVSQYTNRGHLAEVAVMQELTDESDLERAIPQVLEAWEDDFAWYVMMEYGGYPWVVSLKDSNVNDMKKRLEIKTQLVEAAMQPRQISPVVEQLASFSLNEIPCNRAVSKQTIHDWIDHVDCVQRIVHPDIHQVLAIPLAPVDHHLGALIRILGGYENADCTSPTICRSPIIPIEAQLVILRSVLVALNRLHTNGLCHRDVKCENVLVDRELSHIQLIDFGHAANYRCAETPNAPIFTQYGTHLFNPPEVRWPNYHPSGELSYKTERYRGPEADVYALGLMCYEMTYGDLPPELFRIPTHPLMDAIGKAPSDYMSFCEIGGINLEPGRGFTNHAHASIVHDMLLVDPRNRPSVCALLEMVEDLAQRTMILKLMPSNLV